MDYTAAQTSEAQASWSHITRPYQTADGMKSFTSPIPRSTYIAGWLKSVYGTEVAHRAT